MHEFDQGGDAPDYTGSVFGDGAAPGLPEVSIGGEGDDMPMDDAAPGDEEIDTSVVGSEDETVELLLSGLPAAADAELGDIDPDLLDMSAEDLAALRASLAAQVGDLGTEAERLRDEHELLIGEVAASAAASLDDELQRLFGN